MNLKELLLTTIHNRWTNFVETPTGFPDHPPQDTCWIWTGTTKPSRRMAPPQPRAQFLNRLINPRQILYGLHKNILAEDVPRTTTHCGNSLCINPLHVRDNGAPSQAPSLVAPLNPSTIDWSSIFETIPDATSFTPEQLADMTGAPLDAAQDWLA